MIRQATVDDLEEIVRVHAICFPDSFSTTLGHTGGGYLLAMYYKEYLVSNPDLFIVSENESGINGFCMGYLVGENNYTRLYLKHNLLKIIIRMFRLLLSGNKQAWNKIKEIKQKTEDIEFEDESYKNIRKEKKVDLLSICVLPDMQGTGRASDLINMFHRIGKLKEKDYCVLTVKIDNKRGINFYTKHGYRIIKETKSKLSMIKEI